MLLWRLYFPVRRGGRFVCTALCCAVLLFHALPASADDNNNNNNNNNTAPISCVRPPAPDIKVHVTEDPTYFDLEKSRDDLALFRNEANSGHLPSRYHGAVGGVMEGRFEAGFDVSYHQGLGAGFDRNCVSINRIDVHLVLEPTIYIASEFKDHACWFSEIFAHESKHVDVDREIAARYIGKIEAALGFAFQEPEDYAFVDVPDDSLAIAERDLEAAVKGAIGEMFGSMLRERMDAQVKIDNADEYIRIARACPSIEQDRVTPTALP